MNNFTYLINKTYRKNLVYLMILCAALVQSCESFVDLDLPDSQINASEVFNDEQTARGAIGEIYSKLRDESLLMGGNNGIGFLLGLYSDELQNFNNSSLDTQEFYLNDVLPENTYVSSWWQSSYNLIYACNSAIVGLEGSTLPNETRNSLLGQVLFIRSLIHYYLSEIYGDIPYILTTDYQTNSSVTKIDRSELVGFLINDLKNAENLLPQNDSSGENIYPTKVAAQALLARLYLTMGSWEQAEVYASKVISNSQFSFNISIQEVFKKDSPSTIWQLKPGQQGNNTLEAQTYIFTSLPPPNNALTEELINSFQIEDLRKDNWIQEVSDSSATYYHAFKYKLNQAGSSSGEYSIIFRIAEQYLIRAEARYAQGNFQAAAEDLNKIRSRAGLEDINSDAISTETIAEEWFHEFFTEFGHRFISLKRLELTDAILSVRKPGWNPEDKLLPLPEGELLINPNLEPQNSGY